MEIADAKLNEYTKDEWADVAKKLNTEDAAWFEAAWAEFMEEKRRRALNG